MHYSIVSRWATLVVALCLASGAAVATAAPTGGGPMLTFKLFISTNLPIDQVFWTGRRFMYANERAGILSQSDAKGGTIEPFVTFAKSFGGATEMRCAVGVGASWPRGVYCHTPTNELVWISIDGKSTKVIARLPKSVGISDGGIAFDNVGRLGRRVLVSTGASGTLPGGGSIYAISPNGKVALVGAYPGPGGADNITVAPVSFGKAAGSVLIAIDNLKVSGRLLAMDARGKVTVIADHLGNGLNPIQVIRPAPSRRAAGSAEPGLYFSDDATGNVYFAPAAPLRRYVNDVLVGTELHAWFWVVRPNRSRKGYEALRLKTNLPSKTWGIESAAYIP